MAFSGTGWRSAALGMDSFSWTPYPSPARMAHRLCNVIPPLGYDVCVTGPLESRNKNPAFRMVFPAWGNPAFNTVLNTVYLNSVLHTVFPEPCEIKTAIPAVLWECIVCDSLFASRFTQP